MGSRQPLVVAYLFSAVAAVTAILGSLVFMETASVKLTLPTSRLTAATTISGGQSGHDLTTTRIQADVTDSEQGTVSPTDVSATQASGNVEFWCSPACPAQQNVTAGTLVNVDNYVKQYRTMATVKVGPQADVHVAVAVTAVTSGAAGNTAAQTINKINGCSLPPCNLKVSNPSPIAGGVDASTTQVLQQSDLDRVRSVLTAQVTQDLAAAINAQAGGLSFVSGGQPTLKVTVDHNVGDKVPTFTMMITGTVSGVAFSESQADAILRTALTQKLPKGFTLGTDPLQTSYQLQKSGGANGAVIVKGTATAVIVPNVTADELKARIKGMRVDAARRQLELLAPGTTVNISVKPAVPWLPVLQDHIAVTIVLERPTA